MASNLIIQKYWANSDKALVSVIQLPTSDIAHVDMLFKIELFLSSLPEMDTFLLLSVLILLPWHYLFQNMLLNSTKWKYLGPINLSVTLICSKFVVSTCRWLELWPAIYVTHPKIYLTLTKNSHITDTYFFTVTSIWLLVGIMSMVHTVTFPFSFSCFSFGDVSAWSQQLVSETMKCGAS